MANDGCTYPETLVETKRIVEHLERPAGEADRGVCGRQRVVA
jgi:hypothetical protein